ncbi:hypothetical protein F5Y16DRAFT_49826 [Xylariaceae sp. FL0255]|nr:hypothetical protein F5Y16DRAFT_49826 [Xylariaceae sp. FL0255]
MFCTEFKGDREYELSIFKAISIMKGQFLGSSSFWLLCITISSSFTPLVSAQYAWGTPISRTGWNVTADSYQPGNEPINVLDGNSSTFWHTQYTPTVASLPHYIQFDMGKSYVVNGFSYQPRQDGNSNGNIGNHTITLSADGVNWSKPVILGFWWNEADPKTTFFSNTTARYVRLTAYTEAQGQNYQWSSASEINVYSPNPSMDPSTLKTPSPSQQGLWDVSIDLPVIPGAGALSPKGKVIFWSSYRPDQFSGNTGPGQTQTATWDLSTGEISQLDVTQTNHDMFCPGISLDVNGRIVVTGGNNAANTSIYNPSDASWTAEAEMNIPRGYQASVTIGDGRIFTIGGSWSGGLGGKNGEIYQPTTNKWTALPGALVAPMLTADAGGIFRQDNHAWLFSHKANSVFQAGPSKAMNWYNVTSTNGSYTPAGNRGTDSDAMCGTATMFDAVAGLILTTGGSPDYQDAYSTTNANLITLGNAGATPKVQALPSMTNQRIFHNAVVLPDGTVLVMGGQAYGDPFSDDTPAWLAELYNPNTNTWTELASIATPRNYHSIGLLLPDGRVISGGGGMEFEGASGNHFDFQIFYPPYFFNSDGSFATRPTIKSVSSATLSPGATFTATTASTVKSFSMIRYGTATHTVNTDQRRVPLTIAKTQGTTCTFTLPSDPGVLVPGYWMLFAIDSAGVPSEALTVQVLLS